MAEEFGPRGVEPAKPVLEDNHKGYIVEAILQDKWNKRAKERVTNYPVKWVGFCFEHNTLELAKNVEICGQTIKNFFSSNNQQAIKKEKALWGWDCVS